MYKSREKIVVKCFNNKGYSLLFEIGIYKYFKVGFKINFKNIENLF